MSAAALLAVLLGAVLHASWNALVKAGADRLVDTALVSAGSGLLAALALPFLPFPNPASWPLLAASAGIHVVYFLLVAAAYEAGDMGYAYPIMRGTAPLLVALSSVAILGEPLSSGGWIGLLCLSAGILGMAAAHAVAARSALAPGGRATAFALANALVIALYTLVDGVGARRSGHAVAYTLWMLLLTAIPYLALVAGRRGRALWSETRRRWPVALAGGACAAGSYALALWAMTQAPVAVVAALRETSILFGALIAALVLKERFGPARQLAAGAIVAGIVILRLA